MRKLEVNLTPEIESFVELQIAEKKFCDTDSLVQFALEALRDQGEFDSGWDDEALQTEIMIGVEAADQRELVDADEVFDEILGRLDAPAARN